jgi:hypothetical protein
MVSTLKGLNHRSYFIEGSIMQDEKSKVKDEKHFTNYHRVLNRAKWNALNAAKILLGLLIYLIPAGWPLIIAIDETIERRKGKRIKAKGC